MGGWFCRSFLDFRACDFQLIAVCKFGKNLISLLLFAVGFPSDILDDFALGSKGVVAAGKDGNRLTETIAFGNGTKHLLCNQLDDFTLTDGQSADVGLTGNQCGDDCVVVRDLFAVADLLWQNYRRCSFITDTGRADNNGVHAVCHIIGKITAVGSWVGAELLFIETLSIIKGLLCGVDELSVGISLECGQVIEGRNLFCFLFTRNGLYHNRLIVLGDNRFCLGLLFEFLTHGDKSAEVQLCGVKGFGLECFNFGFSLNEQSESGRNNTPDIQGAVVQHGEQTGRIDSDEPVRPLTAACGGKEVVVLFAIPQFTKALFDGVVLHRGNPKSVGRLLASGRLVDIAEDKLALTPGVAGVDNIGYIGTVHQLFQRFKLAVFIPWDFILPVGRNNRKVVVSPLGVLFIISVGIGEFRQMTEAPGHDIITTFDVTVLAVLHTENGGDTHSDRGLFSNHKSFCHGRFSPCLSVRRMLSHVHAPRGASSNTFQKRGRLQCLLQHRQA